MQKWELSHSAGTDVGKLIHTATGRMVSGKKLDFIVHVKEKETGFHCAC